MDESVTILVNTVAAWDGVTAAPHRFGGTEFNVGRVEIGHIHPRGMVDIPFTRELREHLVSAGEAEPHHLLAESGWISFYLRRPDDIANALRLYRLSYLQKTLKRHGLPAGVTLEDELARLGFTPAINAILRRLAA